MSNIPKNKENKKNNYVDETQSGKVQIIKYDTVDKVYNLTLVNIQR